MDNVDELLWEDEDEETTIRMLQIRPPWMSKPYAKPGESRVGRSANKKRDYHARHARLMEQYFCATPIYNEIDFRRRYRMSRRLFDTVLTGVVSADNYFVQRPNAAGRVGISALLKVTAAIRVLAYASSYDAVDENLSISESTVDDCVKRFCLAIIESFRAEFLRAPNVEEVKQLLAFNATRGFASTVGDWSCAAAHCASRPSAGRPRTRAVRVRVGK